MSEAIERAAEARAAGMPTLAARPKERRAAETTGARGAVLAPMAIRSAPDGATRGVYGTASVVEHGYEMYDMFGPYTEVVARDAFDVTLAADPLVEFTLNHNRGGGLPMASTRNGTLVLTATDDGLTYDATVDPARSDVADMLKALERGDLAESSFKFSITSGQWSPDYTEYRITGVDLNRGDVSAVNFGANPAATSFARAFEGRALDAEDVNMLTQAMALFTAIDNIVDEAQETLAAYLKVPNPDADEASELAAAKPAAVRSSVTDDDTRRRTIPGL